MRTCISPRSIFLSLKCIIIYLFFYSSYKWRIFWMITLLVPDWKVTITGIFKKNVFQIWEKLCLTVIPVPSIDTWINGFESTGNFPICIGAVDMKPICIQKPTHLIRTNIFNDTDSNYNFVMIVVGGYGSSSDSRLLQTSQIGRKLFLNKLSLSPPRPLVGM